MAVITCPAGGYLYPVLSFDYPCPDCRSTSNIHTDDCIHSDCEPSEIESAYLDILSLLAVVEHTESSLRENINSTSFDGTQWTRLHTDCLEHLEREHRITLDDGGYRILDPDERRDELAEPTFEPMQTIYEEGSYPGCHDNSVFALIAYFEMVGLSWTETRERTINWLHESGTWDRGGFEESSPEELVDAKQHVYERGYGWRDKAEAAKKVIDQRTGGA